jgi:hypothetical protein
LTWFEVRAMIRGITLRRLPQKENAYLPTNAKGRSHCHHERR